MGCVQVILWNIIVLQIVCVNALAATSVTRGAITWTFDANYTVGQYVNGDYYVVDQGSGVTIEMITPMSTDIAGRIQHGSMLNPINMGQGFDSDVKYNTYTAALNVGRPSGNDISAGNPLVITGGNSLVSSVTDDEVEKHGTQLLDASVLTVVSSAPVDGSFRPSYGGEIKYENFTEAQIDYTKLKSLDSSSIANAPASISDYNSEMSGLWFDPFYGLDSQAYFHPENNMDYYGGAMGQVTSKIFLALQLDYPQVDKETATIQMIQYGLDLYGTLKNATCTDDCTSQGGYYMGGGAIGVGRQLPILFAGVLLTAQDVISLGNGENHSSFQEDGQHFYVAQADVDQERYTADGRPREPYTVGMIGVAEWGEQHPAQPERDGSNWDATYRDIVANSTTTGHVLTAYIMGVSSDLGLPAMLTYIDRWHECSNEYSGTCGTIYQQAFVEEMWDTYRDDYRYHTGSTKQGTGAFTTGTGSLTTQ